MSKKANVSFSRLLQTALICLSLLLFPHCALNITQGPPVFQEIKKGRFAMWVKQQIPHAGVGERYKDRLYHSTDGEAWKLASTPTIAEEINDIAHGGGIFMAVGQKGLLLTSQDGKEWQRQSAGTDAHFDIIGHDGEQFLLLSNMQTRVSLFTSVDARTWSKRSPEVLNQNVLFRNVSCTKGVCVLAGNLNSDHAPARALLWSKGDLREIALPRSVGSCTGCGIKVTTTPEGFLMFSQSALFFSSDGRAWKTFGQYPSLERATFAHHRGRYIGMGKDGILYSKDGKDWQRQALQTTSHLHGIADSGQNQVLIGRDAILHSTDGETWTPASQLPNPDKIRLAMRPHKVIWGKSH